MNVCYTLTYKIVLLSDKYGDAIFDIIQFWTIEGKVIYNP